MEQRLTIITLGVADLTRATAFYEMQFGWTKTGASNENIVFFQLNGIQLALYPKAKLAEDAMVATMGEGPVSFTLAHNVRSEQEVDRLFADFKKKGVTIVKAPQKVFWGGYSGYVSDVDGNLWEVAYNPFLPLDSSGDVSVQ